MMKRLLTMVLTAGIIGAFAPCAQSQEIDTTLLDNRPIDSTTVHIVVRAQYAGDSVMLRWGPTRAGGWSLLNRIGYIVQRREMRNDTSGMAWETLTPVPLKPRPVDEWRKFADDTTNSYPLIAAEAIYGKEFSDMPAVTLAEKADELTNRYSFTLLAADLSYETAVFAGLGYTDRSAQPGKLYTYRVYAAAPLKDYYPADTGVTTLQTVAGATVLRPAWAMADEHEHMVTLYWDRALHDGLYTAFHIERSDDGINFYRLDEQPYLQFSNPALEIDNTHFTYVDSLMDNYVPHWYRLVGINSFGQLSEPSEPVKAMGRDKTPPAQAYNLQTAILEDGSIELTWEASADPDLSGFLIGRSAENSLTGFDPLTESPLPKNSRSFIDPSPRTDAPNYYIVAATDTAKNAAMSMAAHVAFIDSIPPVAPLGLAAMIDTLGVLSLSWTPNPEQDVKGYIVSYANDSTHFFTSAVDAAIPDTLFTDTLSLATLTEEIYYRVRAVDQNDNTSTESAILTVKKPDIIPPVAPQFSDYKVEEGAVKLSWIPSSSDDVVSHELFRRTDGDTTARELVSTIPADSTVAVFVDSTFAQNTRYQYMIQAIDDAGLRSPESATLNIRTLKNIVADGPDAFTANRSENGGVLIRWSLKEAAGVRCVIYRAVNGSAFETLVSFDDGTEQYEDKGMVAGSTYEYTCKLFYQDGRISPFSQIRRVE